MRAILSVWKVFVILLVVYLLGYVMFRSANTEVWSRDGKAYVIFGSSLSYYLFRPVSYADGRLTGMQFHIGPHEQENSTSEAESP